MNGSARALAWSFAWVLSLPTCRVEADDVQEGVDRYTSGDARVTVECVRSAGPREVPGGPLAPRVGGPGSGRGRGVSRDRARFAMRGYSISGS